ncbi:soluble lytic murein transglycosylase-like protein [Aminobacter aminovorans]|uniref:Transglycosylase SLT domain n=1 Tax=Aminobacter aminovorans TaxID=83263 RepID=A0A380WJ61_AMIAI|nr:lytic transglycosylase domain-containing protein [Aminobacter aminovorans]TCS29144.1 soluble lytic murein transglycosylase-like protein [Aminobacter aminovorans]SUU88997.1 Transglycosylase SLT domain [Aminobacter aminovorans]
MPAIKTHLLISAALATALLSGCQTNTAALSTDLSTGADVALNAEIAPASSEVADLALPETVAVIPTTSYASAETSSATAVLAAAAPADASDVAADASTPSAAEAATVAVAAVQPAPAGGAEKTVAAAPAVPAADAAKTVAVADAAPVAPALAKGPVDPMSVPMAGGDVVVVAGAPKLTGEFPSAPTIADYALPASAPLPRSYQVASLGNVAPESFATSSYAAPDSPTLASRGKIDELISKYAALYEVPERLVRRVVNRESTFNPLAYNRGHWGLMQIKHATARGMGYDGPARGLFDAETNLKYAVKYLRGAWMVADGDEDQADKLYQSGYYYHAKRKGLLDETGLGRDRARHRG